MAQALPPGWYYAEGDPPGTQRYWDGINWQGAPQLVGYSPIQAQVYPESSQAVTALILAIVGYVACCLLTCPVGWYIANDEIKAIRAGRRDPANMSLANAAKILGIIGTVIIGLGILGYGGLFLFAGLLSL